MLWEALRLCLVVAAGVAILVRWPRWLVAALVVAWAIVAAPFGIWPGDRGGPADGDEIAESLPSGWHGVDAATVKLRKSGGDDGGHVVAWSVAALPWPHVDRARVNPVDGKPGDWSSESVRTVREDGKLYVAGNGVSAETGKPTEQSYEIGWRLSPSVLTWLGWLALGGATAARIRSSRRQPA